MKAAQTSFQRSCPINWRQNVGIKILWHDDVYRGCGLEEPWTLGRKKKHGIHNGFMGWFKVAHSFTKKQLVDRWNMLKPRSLSKILVNKTPSILKDECYRSWFGLRIEKWLHWGPWLEPGPEQRPPYLVERTAGIDRYGKHQQTIVDIGKHWM